MNSSLLIREALPGDDEIVGELLVEAYVKAYAQKMPEVVVTDERKRELRSVAAKRKIATVLVAELDGHLVGTVAVFKPGTPESEAWLANAADIRHLAVDPRLHGRDLSKPLLDEAERIARSWGIDAICLHVHRRNYGVARLYMKRGYIRDSSGDLDYPSVSLEGYVLQCKPSSSELTTESTVPQYTNTLQPIPP